MTMADKIVVMRAGRIEQTGAPLDLYDRPANVFVASFIGSPSMNLIPGTIKGGMVEIDGPAGDAAARLPIPADANAQDGQAVLYGIRPEHLALAETGQPGTLTATVAVIEPTGAETHVMLRHNKQDITAAVRNRVTLSAGDHVALEPNTTLAHLFDKQSGQRL
jgi:multiple sugar transport system ATP-binding protein